MTETEWKWLVVGAIIGVVIAYRMLTARAERRRRVWFDEVASALKATAEHTPDRRSRCGMTHQGRAFEVTHGYVSAQAGADYRPGWTFRTETKLRGVSDIYNISFRRKRNGELESRRFGFEPRAGWETPALRRALTKLFEAASALDAVDVEGGSLRFRSYGRPDAEAVRTIIAAQAVAAEELERAL